MSPFFFSFHPIAWSHRHSWKQRCKHSVYFFVARSDDFNCQKRLATNPATFSHLRENVLALTPRHFIDKVMWKHVRFFWKVRYCDCKIQRRCLSGDVWSPSGDLASSTHKCRGVYHQQAVSKCRSNMQMSQNVYAIFKIHLFVDLFYVIDDDRYL